RRCSGIRRPPSPASPEGPAMRPNPGLIGGARAPALGAAAAGLPALPRPAAADPAAAAVQPPTEPPPVANPNRTEPALPIRAVVLFNSGVGYFQREGQVEGDARVDLSFPASEVNDLLKSLVLQDLGGGQVTAVSYDSQDPVER